MSAFHTHPDEDEAARLDALMSVHGPDGPDPRDILGDEELADLEAAHLAE